MTADGAGLRLGLLEAPRHRRDAAAAGQLARERGLEDRSEAMLPASRSTSPRAARCCTWPCVRRPANRSWSTARTSCRTFTRCSTAWPTSPTAFAAATWKGHTGKRDPQRRQHRHRRLRPGPVMAYEALRHYSAARPDVPVRLERRRHRLRRGHARPRPGRDAVHRLVEDLHHAGDDDQRRTARASGCSAALGGRGRGRQALRRRLDRTPRRCRSSASTPPTCSASGIGWAAATRWIRRSGSRR